MRFDEYRTFDATALGGLVRRGEVHARELAELALERIAATNPLLNAVSVIDEAFARRTLEAGLPALEKGEADAAGLAGVPFLLKDLFAFLDGTALTNGSRMFSGFRCTHTGTWIARALAAGLLPLGKTTAPENGVNVTTEPLLHGAVRNPWRLTRSAGGSSGGAAAAVAAGIVPIAHASDGGGSIRIPAACCGLIGLKPSRGRTPMGPIVGEGWNGLVTTHVLTHTVRDSALMLDLTHGAEAGDPYACPAPERPFRDEVEAPCEGLRVALATTLRGAPSPHPECEQAAIRIGHVLERLGHQVERLELDLSFEELAFAMRVIVGVNLVHDLGYWSALLGRPLDETQCERITLRLAEDGRSRSGLELARAIGICHRAARALGGLFRHHDVLLSPTLAQPVPTLGTFDQNGPDLELYLERSSALIPMTPLYNMTGCPAISVPAGRDHDGMPLAVMLGAALGGEGRLLRLAAALERELSWCVHGNLEIDRHLEGVASATTGNLS